MNFALYCIDKAGHGAVRAENRPAHLDYLNRNLEQLMLAGPLLGDDGTTVLGSLLVIEAADRAAAEAFAAGDPYAKAGLFESVTIKAFRSEEHTSELQSLMRISYAV